ncbi:NAD(P)H-hydrate dehydratase [Pontibacter sp. JAM-7]|uniref:NAD(P)H-hydrate dehydratase n=1 Tax=Pontibacter sp. JAM-7 TaxID=3366581 RepID=UPI003AF8C6A5
MSHNRAQLPAPLYTAEQTRLLDRTAIEQFGIPGYRLMQRAGHAVFAVLQARFPSLASLTILAGSGNNGGDGFVVAALAHQQGISVQLLCVGYSDFAASLQGEALQAWQHLLTTNLVPETFTDRSELTGDVIVDALLGTGLQGSVREPFLTAIKRINRCGKPVMAVDIPSGLCADTGMVLGQAVRADMTLSFIGLNRGLLTADGSEFSGQVLFDSLHLPEEVYDEVPVQVFRTGADDLAELLPRRCRNAHKGLCGHLLVVGGELGMGGAALLAAEAALRAGVGRVTLATRQAHVSAALARCPEVMSHGVETMAHLDRLLTQADVVVIGPGLGQSAWGEQMLQCVLAADKPMVVDADALNLMAIKGLFTGRQASSVFTPHPGEASNMLARPVAELQANRFEAVACLQRLCGGAVVLKGAGSLSCAGEVIHLCNAGNPGMSVAGMGDVLSGICGALLGQGLAAEDAARLAVYVHAVAADQVAKMRGERGIMASDLFLKINQVINGLHE